MSSTRKKSKFVIGQSAVEANNNVVGNDSTTRQGVHGLQCQCMYIYIHTMGPPNLHF